MDSGEKKTQDILCSKSLSTFSINFRDLLHKSWPKFIKIFEMYLSTNGVWKKKSGICYAANPYQTWSSSFCMQQILTKMYQTLYAANPYQKLSYLFYAANPYQHLLFFYAANPYQTLSNILCSKFYRINYTVFL